MKDGHVLADHCISDPMEEDLFAFAQPVGPGDHDRRRSAAGED